MSEHCDIRDMILTRRESLSRQGRRALQYAPGRIHTSLLVASAVSAPAIWVGLLALSLATLGDPFQVWHGVAVGFATVLAPVAAILATSWVHRSDRAAMHDELLVALGYVSQRTLSHAEAVDRTVQHLASALPGGGRVSQIR